MPLYGNSTFYPFISWFWIISKPPQISKLLLLLIMWLFMYSFSMCIYIYFISLGLGIYLGMKWLGRKNCTFDLLRNVKLLKSGCTILYSYQQYILISPHPHPTTAVKIKGKVSSDSTCPLTPLPGTINLSFWNYITVALKKCFNVLSGKLASKRSSICIFK